ncbi:mitochondrial thiamine diphosphate carrier 2 [Babesia caballi]|uniref:Mitochondrial thiamine diphosphate carrier 2 n=1 Tax=Babesia caballi TaxID=5871 RepID=A0AAV4LZI6_BABCB|nr:mitochondrial thiamine diphosphate carrier 2 [Babesia caballi]
MADDVGETAAPETAPEFDLFAGDSDYEEEVPPPPKETADETSVETSSQSEKTTRKNCLLSLENFWHNRSDDVRDVPNYRKNILWDFMVYHNIREEREGTYASSVRRLEAEATRAIKQAKVAILTEVSQGGQPGLFAKEVAIVFDRHVAEMLNRYHVKSIRGSLFHSRWLDDYDYYYEAPSDKVAIEAYLEAHEEFKNLKEKLVAFRKGKNKLMVGSLNRLMSSIDGLRSKVVNEIYEPNSRGHKRLNLTRFLRHMGKISGRSEFAGEYRFNLLRTFVNNKDELETFIQNNSVFSESGHELGRFEDFVNSFTPDYVEIDEEPVDQDMMNDYDFDATASNDVDLPASDDHMMNFMNATPPDDIMEPPASDAAATGTFANESPSENPADVPSAPSEKSEQSVKPNVVEESKVEDDTAQMRLLEEARTRAAEILRQKRLARAAATASSTTE